MNSCKIASLLILRASYLGLFGSNVAQEFQYFTLIVLVGRGVPCVVYC
jgi:hypothetical protein